MNPERGHFKWSISNDQVEVQKRETELGDTPSKSDVQHVDGREVTVLP